MTAGLWTLSSDVQSLDTMVYTVLLNGQTGLEKVASSIPGKADNLTMLRHREGVTVCLLLGSARKVVLQQGTSSRIPGMAHLF